MNSTPVFPLQTSLNDLHKGQLGSARNNRNCGKLAQTTRQSQDKSHKTLSESIQGLGCASWVVSISSRTSSSPTTCPPARRNSRAIRNARADSHRTEGAIGVPLRPIATPFRKSRRVMSQCMPSAQCSCRSPQRASARSVMASPRSMMSKASTSSVSVMQRGGLVKNVFQRTNV